MSKFLRTISYFCRELKKKEQEMSDKTATEEEAKAVTSLIQGAKILAPGVIAIASVIGVYFKMDDKISDQEALQVVTTKEVAKLEGKIETLEDQAGKRDVTLAQVKSDLQHIKDDTKETLDLVRDWMRGQ